MFVRVKKFSGKRTTRQYLQVVESFRAEGKMRQRVLCTLGRLERLQDGGLDALIQGLSKFSKNLEIIRASQDLVADWSKEYGAVLVFRKLWEELKMDQILKHHLKSHRYKSDIGEAVFALVLNRILEPYSKKRAELWLEEVYEPRFSSLRLQHFYRCLDFLSEHKPKIEEELFGEVKDLFNLELDVVFYDTTSVYFEGEGPEGLAKKGYSKDKRPDLNQILIGVLMTKEGIPIGCEVFPGNCYDGSTLKCALEVLSKRFHLKRVIFVGDRAMVSQENLSYLEQAGYEYILGVRMRQLRDVNKEVLSRAGRYHLVNESLWVKQVKVGKARYILCFNPEEAKRDAEERKVIVDNLEEKIKGGSLKKVLKGDAQRYLKLERQKFTLDYQKIETEARYDGKYVLRTNTELSAEEVALAYKNLWLVENTFRNIKDILKIRPIFLWTEARVKGHVFICFLAFLLTVTLQKKLLQIAIKESLWKILRDVGKVKAVLLRVKNEPYLVRTELKGTAHLAFKSVGLSPPPRVKPL
ncbi:MAG: IS1634 family transposase [Candidatus Aminicenantales bacterium]